MKQPILIVLCVLFIYACSKVSNYHHSQDNSAEEKFDLKAAKDWYYGTFKKQASFRNKEVASYYYHNGQDNKYPAWQYCKSYQIGKWEVAEMPLYLDNRVVLIPNAASLSNSDKQRVRRAVIEKVAFLKNTNSGKVVTRIVQFVPDINYLRSHNFDISQNSLNHLDSDFTGWVISRTWSGKTLKFWRVENGYRKKQVKLVPRIKKANLAALRSEECGFVEVEKVHRTCVIVPPAGDIPDDPGECEDWDETITYETEYVCTEVPDEDPCGPVMSEDCACAYYGVCDDGGGDDGGGGGVNEPPAEDDDIKEELQDSCLQAAYNKIANINLKNKITQLLFNTFGQSKQLNITIVQVDTLPSAIMGRTNATDAGGTMNVLVRLNAEELPYTTQEFVVATIFHEIVHAFLITQGMEGLLNQHNNIADDYFNELKDALKESFPDLPDDQIAALTWSGLEQTNAYGELSQALKTEITELNNYHAAASPNYGTKCKDRPNN